MRTKKTPPPASGDDRAIMMLALAALALARGAADSELEPLWLVIAPAVPPLSLTQAVSIIDAGLAQVRAVGGVS